MEEERSIGHEIKTLNNLMCRRFDRDWKRYMDEDVTVMHTWILIFIRERGEQATFQRDVEKEFEISRSTATNILQLMEKKELITRASVKYDERLKKLCLTEKGHRITEKMRQMTIRSDRELVKGIEPEKIETFYDVLDNIRHNIETQM